MNTPTAEDEIYGRGIAAHAAGKLPEAEALYRQVLARRPTHGHALFGLGTIALEVGKNDVAVWILLRAAAISPSAPLYNTLGEAYRALGRADEADAAYRKAIAINPNDCMPYNNLGIVLCLQGRLREAEDLWRKAIELNPTYADAFNNLGNAMLEQGEAEESVGLYRKVLQLKPDFAGAHSNLLRGLSHLPTPDPVAIRLEHENWWTQQARGVVPRTSWNNSRDPERPIRVGLLSPDLREHSVAYFLEPWIAGRDRAQIKVLCYSELTTHDRVTERLCKITDGWRSTMGVSDEVVVKQILDDQIDILIDLAGHTSSNRLRVLAFRPAPVQASFLGYPSTTGGRQVDWKITDLHADPPGMTEIAYTEKLWRLPRTNWCYRPLAESPAVVPPPVESAGHITFGSFNNYSKVTHQVLETWAALLKRVDRSKLLLKANALGDEGVRRRVIERFVALGVIESRLILLGRQEDIAAHLGTYARVDIGLDTFPYNGTTTTCQSLWMGVPVIGLAGRLHIERVGVSLLGTVGLSDLVASDLAGYIDTAAKLATDLPRLAELRRTTRDRVRASALTDEPAYARDFDAALRGMWRQWCAGSPPV